MIVPALNLTAEKNNKSLWEVPSMPQRQLFPSRKVSHVHDTKPRAQPSSSQRGGGKVSQMEVEKVETTRGRVVGGPGAPVKSNNNGEH